MDLQAIAATGWGFVERAYIGGWELRAAGNHTSRANCAIPVSDSGMPLPETLKAVREWFTERDLRGRVQAVDGSPLDQAIAELGYPETVGHALRQSAPLLPALEILRDTADPQRTAEIPKELPEDYFTVYRRGLGIPEFQAILTTGDRS